MTFFYFLSERDLRLENKSIIHRRFNRRLRDQRMREIHQKLRYNLML
jgi:hypothetical protein